MLIMVNTDSIAPAAPRVCPVIDLVDDTIGGSLKISSIAFDSAMSPRGVEVPWAFI